MKKNDTKIRNSVIALLRLNSNYYSFLGGVFISTSVNFYTSVFAADTRPDRWLTFLLAAILTLISGFFWTALAWNLEPLQAIIRSAPSENVNQESAWKDLVSPKLRKLWSYLLISFMSALFGLMSLLIK